MADDDNKQNPSESKPLDESDRRLLSDIVSFAGAATSRELGMATRESERSRQRCKRRGLVTFEGGYWHITEAGRAALGLKSEAANV